MQRSTSESELSALLLTKRSERGWTQEACASALGVSIWTLGSWETGRRHPSKAALVKLIALFGDDPAGGRAWMDADEVDRGWSRRHFLGGAVATTAVAGGRSSHRERVLRHLRYVTELSGMAVEHGLVAGEGARYVIGEYEGRRFLTDTEREVLAIAYCVVGVSVAELDEAPPLYGRAMLTKSVELARPLGRADLVQYALWRRAEQHRKDADADRIGRHRQKTYGASLNDLAEVLQLGGSPVYAALVFSEQMKIAASQGHVEPFKAAWTKAQHLLERMRAAPSASEKNTWHPVTAGYVHVHVRAAILRGLAKFPTLVVGSNPYSAMSALASEARVFDESIAPIFSRAALVLPLVTVGLRDDDVAVRGRAVEDLGAVLRYSRDAGFRKQLTDAKRIVEDAALSNRLPEEFERQCARCRNNTTWVLNRSQLFYVCGSCYNAHLPLIA